MAAQKAARPSEPQLLAAARTPYGVRTATGVSASKRHATGPDLEKSKVAGQKLEARFQSVQTYLLVHQALYAARGAVVARWRTYSTPRYRAHASRLAIVFPIHSSPSRT